MRRLTTFLALLLCSAGATLLAQDLKSVRVKITSLDNGIYMLATRVGGNLGVCTGEDGVLLIDSEYAQLNPKVKTAIAAVNDKPVRFLINTHWHFDHTGGNPVFGKEGSLIIAHENVRKRLAVDQRIGTLGREVPALPEEGLPVITFTKSIAFHTNGQEIEVIHMPGAHTDGDGVVLFKKANVIHAGDIFFNCGYPFIDVEAGGDIDGMIEAVKAILKLCDDKTRIIPGHGPLASKEDMETYRDMLCEFRAVVAKEMAAGKDLKTILAEKPTAELDKKWGNVFFQPDKFTEIVFLSLDRKKGDS